MNIINTYCLMSLQMETTQIEKDKTEIQLQVNRVVLTCAIKRGNFSFSRR